MSISHVDPDVAERLRGSLTLSPYYPYNTDILPISSFLSEIVKQGETTCKHVSISQLQIVSPYFTLTFPLVLLPRQSPRAVFTSYPLLSLRLSYSSPRSGSVAYYAVCFRFWLWFERLYLLVPAPQCVALLGAACLLHMPQNTLPAV